MRWYWIDRFLEFESGKHAVAVKNVSLAEEHLHDHFPGIPIMPNSLIIEGMAQTAGLLVGEYFDFRERVILAKVSKAVFTRPARPGDRLEYRAELQEIQQDGAITTVICRTDDEVMAEAGFVFAHLDHDRQEVRPLFEPAMLAMMLRGLGIYEVGRKQDGSPLTPPAALAEVEEKVAGQ